MIAFTVLAVFGMGCGSADSSAGPDQEEAAAAAVKSVRIDIDTSELIAGATRRVFLHASDREGRSVSSDRATLTSLNPDVVSVDAKEVFVWRDYSNGPRWVVRAAELRLITPGRAKLRVSLDGVSDSVTIDVHPPRPSATALVVDSFAVIEFRPICAWQCPYLAYAPLLKIREATGGRTATLVSIEFRVGNRSTGLCGGPITFGAGMALHIDQSHENPWANELQLLSTSGVPFAENEATVRITARDWQGNLSVTEARRPIQRLASAPLPAHIGERPPWQCVLDRQTAQ